MGWKTLDQVALAGRRVLVRVDLNVPMEAGHVTDATRIERLMPTLRHILDAGGSPLLLSHFARPRGRVVPEMSLRPLADPLQRIAGAPVVFCADCRGPAAQAAVAALPEGAILLLENTRFHPGEEANDPALAAEIAALGDVYCNDAFSCAHRAHATTEGLAHLLPSCAGRLMQDELRALEAALGAPDRPLVAVVGGAKVSSKLTLLANLVEQVDALVIGGGMANTFLAAQGHPVGISLCEHEMTGTARDILDKARITGCEIVLPSDIVVARSFKAHAPHEVLCADACPTDAMILDAGPASVARIGSVLAGARTLIWNGPLGAFELPPFDTATIAAARAAAELTETGGMISVAGGGDTVAALNAAGVADRFTYVSSAGGAFLEWMEGNSLPGVAALAD